ncbi:TcdA/TcdB catalytic glycosyltransferase domain-containing protein [Streptomyces noursei]|uniref:TcdA/TcdB catalytic glycosyltransferase domain-containing protein n=1 Tax=Streptomyces noursei TaxID=1971 RepID=UPI001678CBC0|nr:TcdA/TcdB catalytic glycosyltransferase domain-containing protein [Streptomyces noursei]MCZ1021261.1 glycosyltransferase [Streptomyces noursei]
MVNQTIHLIWLGGALSADAQATIRLWLQKAGTSWRVRLWTDFGGKGSNASFFEELQSAGVQVEVVAPDDLFAGSDPTARNMRELYAMAVARRAFAMASDLIRYQVLYTNGGIYVDVDIAPGKVTLPEGLEYDKGAVPVFGPLIRDAGHLATIISGLGDSAPTRREDWLPIAAAYQFDKPELGNAFVLAPRGAFFLMRLMQGLPNLADPLTRKLMEAADLKREAGAKTGPGKVGDVLLPYLKDRHQLPTRPRMPALKQYEPVMFAEGARFLGLEWLTVESERQEHLLDPVGHR